MAADQVAPTPFSIAMGQDGGNTLHWVNTWAWDLHLVIDDTSGLGGWDLVPGPSVTAPGVTTITNHCQLFGSGYPPAYSSDDICGGNLVGYQVESFSWVPSVPEPHTLPLALLGLLGVAMFHRLRAWHF
jgi:PEP-CTERM motif-containing protein